MIVILLILHMIICQKQVGRSRSRKLAAPEAEIGKRYLQSYSIRGSGPLEEQRAIELPSAEPDCHTHNICLLSISLFCVKLDFQK